MPVLIIGESGTGKELAALAIHRLSARKDGPFITINCGAIPETLLESELFGHEKGAFTGAHIQRKGRIEPADGGTLFLDEIGDLPALLQVKLLRFLQEQRDRARRRPRADRIDVRVIAATNARPQGGDEGGPLPRGPLLPPRGRHRAVPAPARRDRGHPAAGHGPPAALRRGGQAEATGFTPQALRAMEAYAWPGNVRELENRIKRAVIMAEGKKLTPAISSSIPSGRRYQGLSLKEAREAVEKELIQRALARNKGNITKAAAELGVSRPTLYELMEKLGISKGGRGEGTKSWGG